MQPDNEPNRKHVYQLTTTNPIVLTFDLVYCAILGVNTRERIVEQKLFINLMISLNEMRPNTLEIRDIIDNLINQQLRTLKPLLLERMALVIGDMIIDRFPSITALDLTIKKPEALKFADHARVNMRIERN